VTVSHSVYGFALIKPYLTFSRCVFMIAAAFS